MAHYNFHKDIKVGEAAEIEFAKLMEAEYDGSKITFNKTSAYDIRVETNDRDWTFEVKNDLISQTTQNLGIEYETRGKPSGIETTEADIWVHKTYNRDGSAEFWLFQTYAIEKAIEDNAFFRSHTGGDYGSNTKFYLFKKEVIGDYAYMKLDENGKEVK